MCIWKTTKPKKAKSRDEASEMPDRNKDSPVTGPGPSHMIVSQSASIRPSPKNLESLTSKVRHRYIWEKKSQNELAPRCDKVMSHGS